MFLGVLLFCSTMHPDFCYSQKSVIGFETEETCNQYFEEVGRRYIDRLEEQGIVAWTHQCMFIAEGELT